MALIVEYHVVADMYPVGGVIKAGMAVALNTDGEAVAAPANGVDCIGLAGDSALDAEGKTTAYSDELVLGAGGGGTRWTSNRVSDFYDETTASQKITVYNGGGKFWISEDIFDSAATIAINDDLQVGATAGQLAAGAGTGVGDAIAKVVGTNQAYDSGVPGTDLTQGSISLGSYVPVILRV